MSSPIHTAIVELRQYTLHDGARDRLVALFDREFVDTQEACGVSVIGQFFDLDRPDRFVWLRSFADMEQRREALERFYGGPDWARHRDEANATMIDFDDVHLLRPVDAGELDKLDTRQRSSGTTVEPGDEIDILVLPVRADALGAASRWFSGDWLPKLRDAGAATIAALATEPGENSYPRLPIRTDSALVWIGRLGIAAGSDAVRSIDAAGAPWIDGATGVTRLRLRPTPRSLLR